MTSTSKKNIGASKTSTVYINEKPVRTSVSTKSVIRPPIPDVSDEPHDPLITIPPDGGCGWFIVVCAMLMNFVSDGISYTFGIFIIEISHSFRTTPTLVAITSSVMTGSYYLIGPLVCAIINRYGFRVTGVIGGFLSCIAIGISSLLNSLISFVFIFGVLCGFGFCMIYVPSIMIVGFYFEKWRAVATSITVCGSSVGMITFPLIFRVLLNDVSWRVKYQILSGMCFICGLLALSYRPLKPVRVAPEDKKVQFVDSVTSVSTAATAATAESTEKISVKEDTSGIILTFFRRFLNRNYKSVAEVSDQNSVLVTPSRTSTVSYMVRDISMSSVGNRTNRTQSRSIIEGDKLSTLVEEEDLAISRRACCIRCERYCAKKCPCCYPPDDVITTIRPMYRDDILYQGSVYTLSEYSAANRPSRISKGSSRLSKRSTLVDYHISVTRVTTQKDLEEDRVHCICCPEAMTRTLATMLEFGLMKSPSFNLILMSGFFTTLGMYTPFIYISQYAIQKKMETSLSVYLISAVGVSNCVGRLACGVISSLPHVGALRFSCMSLIVCGGFTISSVSFYSASMLFVFAAVYGLSIAALPSLRSIMLVDMFGLERLTNAFGLVMLFQGIACLAGLPISGALIDYTGAYDACFIFSGSSITFSGLLLIPVKFMLKWERKKQAKRMEEARAKSKKVTIV